MATPTASGNPTKNAENRGTLSGLLFNFEAPALAPNKILQWYILIIQLGPHNAATPQSQPHLPNFSSPAPRSVPSPAAQRQAGKSPFAVTTQAHSSSSATVQNHPTVGSSGSASKALLGSSPAAAMVNFESPMGMGMSFSLSQMAGVEGGVPMASGMSGLSGLGLMSMGGTSDEERWRRLNEVMEKLKSRPGRVSLENVRALGRRLGFEEMLEQPRTGDSVLTFAGRTVMVEMAFSPQNEITKVDVQFPEPSTALQETAASASTVFYDCLAVPAGRSSITNMLDRFAANLEKLAKIDKPHGAAGDGFNGFEAIFGIHSSLRKLYNHERELARRLYEGADDADEKAITEVTCKKSGRPRMNEDGKIGLDLDYWITRRHIQPSTARHDELPSQNTQSASSSNNDVFTLSIQCEALLPGQMTQPARISDAWISDRIEKASEDAQGVSEHSPDWLEPPPTYISPAMAGETTESAAIEQATGKLPNVRFVAKLRPPLLIPAEIAAQSSITQDFSYHTLPSYVAPLLLHQNPLDALINMNQLPPREIYSEKTTVSGNMASKSGPVRHANTLRVRTYDTSILLHDIPFEHPKQLIELLPVSVPI
jgi:hypothetical protein